MSDFGFKMALEFLKQPLILSVIILGLLSGIFYKRIIGAIGEFWVRIELKKLPKEYRIINNIMVIVNNKSSQIDHLVVSKYGIFVIETKQYNGYLAGKDYDKKWTVKAGNRKYYINNPIHQNYGHVQSLKEVLNIDENKFVPIVCISSNARVNIQSDKVVLITNLIRTITSYQKEIISNDKEIYYQVLSINITDKEKRKRHIKDIKQNTKQKNKDYQCPKCGGELVERKGQYGKFLGCSNYPKCRFTKSKE